MDWFDFVYTRLLTALCGFLAVVAAIRHYAPRTSLPAESWLLLAGIGYGLLSPQWAALPEIRVVPELILGLILPVVVFAAGRHLPIGLLLRCSGPVALLALAGTLLSIVLIGLPLAWLLDIPYMHGLLFGAGVAATDPGAAKHVLARFRIPPRLAITLHGESILNDSITIVLFTALAAVVIADADFSLLHVGIEATRSMLLAIPVGLLAGWLMGLLVRHWGEQNRVPGLALTFALSIAAFLLSERLLHVSGIIAVLCAALAFSHARSNGAVVGRELYDELWNYLGTLGASVLYFALGAAIGAHGFGMGGPLVPVLLLFLLSRAVLVYGSGPLLRLHGRALPRSWRHTIMLGGLRGAVPAALVLMIPAHYVHHDALLAVVFTLVAYSVIVHPLLLQSYLKRHPIMPMQAHDEPGPDPHALPVWLQRVLDGSDWGRAAIAGLVAGVVFLALEVALVGLFDDAGAWAPLRMIAAIGMGSGVLPPPATLALDVALVAALVHFTLSLIYAWLVAFVVQGRALPLAAALGMACGLAIYLINFYLFTAMFPWFADARNWITILAHLVFGGVLAGSYIVLGRCGRPQQA